MSISIGHRAIFTAFGHRNTVARREHAPSAPEFSPGATGDVVVPFETGVSHEAGELKCSPWEGLYLEQARPVSTGGGEAGPGRQLDSFLAGLMYGE
ncbi:hypothetical protein DXK94_03305 [Arthrobacter sp. RT-1]|uniref:hypothetical protein n=1 Tax=Arthrobacter sp. RT-1 TaxID=2292263 RepID=UPI000E1F18AC|nr:hypothetical protein [Arthrobacter sp. RT-1]RDV12361.1 hypothetical protein DXK94_03305 [Arthrobacter sp. RT-1]